MNKMEKRIKKAEARTEGARGSPRWCWMDGDGGYYSDETKEQETNVKPLSSSRTS